MLPLFCLKENSNTMAITAPMVRLISVPVIPDARYLLRTIITNSEGARAHKPMIKLLISSMAVVPFSLDRCLIRLFIMCVFNVLGYLMIGSTSPSTLCNWYLAICQSICAFRYATSLIRCAVFMPNTAIMGELPA